MENKEIFDVVEIGSLTNPNNTVNLMQIELEQYKTYKLLPFKYIDEFWGYDVRSLLGFLKFI